jgi:hypothetical protein
MASDDILEARRQLLDVSVYQGRLVISIGVETLATAARNAPNLEIVNANNDFVGPTITDPNVFAEEVRQALEKEEEDGTTPVHELLDAAFETAIDDGSQVAFMADEEVDDVD